MKYIDNTVQNVFAELCWHLFDQIYSKNNNIMKYYYKLK